MAVFVVDSEGNPLMPCSERHARKLLERGEARLNRFYPFSIGLTDQNRPRDGRQELTLKISPGSESTGFALVRRCGGTTQVLFLAELVHRGRSISKSLYRRRILRRRRRSANLRYRSPRFLNRPKPSTWLPPSILHRVETVTTWVRRFSRLAPITSLVAELKSFDSRELTLKSAVRAGRVEHRSSSQLRRQVYDIWGRKCVYCDAEDMSFQLDHVVPRSQGGSNRVPNRVPTCNTCNKKKGTLSIQAFLVDRPTLLQTILMKMKDAMHNTAATEAMRRGLYLALARGSLPLEVSTTESTRANSEQLRISLTPALKAACTGITGTLIGWEKPVLRIACVGRGSYQRTGRYIKGRIKGDHRNRQFLTRKKMFNGFRTGDLVKAKVKMGNNPGLYRGRATVKASGRIQIHTNRGEIHTSFRNCRLIQRSDGYAYSVIRAPSKGAAQSVVECSDIGSGGKRTNKHEQ